MYTVHTEKRVNWFYTVRWGGGRTYCRCPNLRTAVKIRNALNRTVDLDAPLTEAEKQKIQDILS